MLLAAGTGAIEAFRPDTIDPEYSHRLSLFHQQTTASERPSVMVMGSSRIGLSFVPEELPPIYDSGGRSVVAFNASHVGAGPVTNLVLLRRLLRDGVRPTHVILEVMPSFLSHESYFLLASCCSASDVSLAATYMNRADIAWEYVHTGAVLFPHRARAACAPPEPAENFGPLGGRTDLLKTATPEFRARATFVQTHVHELKDFQIADEGDRALRDTIALCRTHDIGIVLLMTPEGTPFRALYGPGREELFAGYVNRVGLETGVTVIDARRWLRDDEFYDSHHALQTGASTFTARLGHDVITPLVGRDEAFATADHPGSSPRSLRR
ncbi:hypothetical protein FRUB_00394 [Fimbriiglobus ruber]|uniref:Uncharacterized protein n=1 Tax=Fimbriiglobus ruber TaxID=1908690 RepID=A0A225EE82_9BACT|nr:hypothetical protein FRUB_00394 [Fimbriiglobus ruber]